MAMIGKRLHSALNEEESFILVSKINFEEKFFFTASLMFLVPVQHENTKQVFAKALINTRVFVLCNRLCPGVSVHRGNSHCTPLFMNLFSAVENCWVFFIGSCEPVHEDRTL